MNHTRIKICGITNKSDARVAWQAGADAIGMVFYEKSPRNVELSTAKEIGKSLPPFVTMTGLFVNSSEQEVKQVLKEVALDLLQFHGDEDEKFCRRFGRPYVKVIRVEDYDEIDSICRQYPSARGILLDSYKKGTPGGTGEILDWNRIPKDISHPVILAGGLNPENVGKAISKIQPWAVDVSSGVEHSPGVKDPQKVERFIRAAHAFKS